MWGKNRSPKEGICSRTKCKMITYVLKSLLNEGGGEIKNFVLFFLPNLGDRNRKGPYIYCLRINRKEHLQACNRENKKVLSYF